MPKAKSDYPATLTIRVTEETANIVRAAAGLERRSISDWLRIRLESMLYEGNPDAVDYVTHDLIRRIVRSELQSSSNGKNVHS